MPTNHEFTYQTWTPSTILSFVRVPWDAAYVNVWRPDTPEQRDAWIDSQETPQGKIIGASYAPVNRPIRVNIPFNKMQKYNYVRASNPGIGGDEQRNWYYFIQDIRYVALNTTEIVVQMDYFQCYAYDLHLTQGFVERGHILNAATNRFDNYGRDYLSVPEGFDTGSEYRQIAHRTDELMGVDYSGAVPTIDYDILVISTIDLMADDYGTIDNPKKPNATGTIFEGLSHGAGFYVFESAPSFMTWLNTKMKDKAWIVQGILSITIIPKLSRYMPGYEYGEDIKHANGYTPFPRLNKFYPDWRNSNEIRNSIPERYRRFEKFLTSPFMGIEITTWSATPIVLKPESWADPDALVMERSTFTPPNQRVEIGPRHYNAKTGAEVENYQGVPDSILAQLPGGLNGPIAELYRDKGDDGGEYLDHMTRITSFPTMAILNDAATLYMASNAHGIASQFNNASWGQRKGIGSAQLGYNNTQAGIRSAQQLGDISRASDLASTMIGINLANDSWALQSISGILSGGAGGLTAGPQGAAIGAGMAAGGALTSGMQNTLNTAATAAQSANRRKTSLDSQNVGTETTGYIADRNKDFAMFAARGDYAATRQGIMAGIQDAQLIPPATVGQMGGETMNLVNGTMEISVRWKMIDEAHIAQIGEFWLRYGYAVERFIRSFPANMHAMSKFTYWKVTETMTNNAPVPEFARAVFRGIHEKGVTYWKNPEDIGTVDYADNQPLAGMTI